MIIAWGVATIGGLLLTALQVAILWRIVNSTAVNPTGWVRVSVVYIISGLLSSVATAIALSASLPAALAIAIWYLTCLLCYHNWLKMAYVEAAGAIIAQTILGSVFLLPLWLL